VLKAMPDASPQERIQAMFILDSLPFLQPERRYDDDEAHPMAQQAKMYADNIPLIKSQLSAKNCVLFAVNQIRLRPGVSYGSPIYEPCGEAAKHASDVRLMTSSRSVPSGKGGKVEEEGCWDGKGKDRYVYAIMRTVKHKMFSPFRETWMRIWFEEKGMPGRGIDPVYDTYQYLMMTDQMKEARGFFTMELDGYTGTARLTWDQFKALILSPDARREPGTAVRAMCRRQFATGEAFDRYFGASGGGLGQRAGADVMDAENVEVLDGKSGDPAAPVDEPKLPSRKRGRKPAAAQTDDTPDEPAGAP
jgi:RecA/RadA recombinase